MASRLLTAKQVAKILHKSEKTLSNWRRNATGPEYSKDENGRILYLDLDVQKWLLQTKVRHAEF